MSWTHTEQHDSFSDGIVLAGVQKLHDLAMPALHLLPQRMFLNMTVLSHHCPLLQVMCMS